MALWPSVSPRTASISCRVGSHWLPPHPRNVFPISVNFPKLPKISRNCWLANWNSLVSSQAELKLESIWLLGCPTILSDTHKVFWTQVTFIFWKQQSLKKVSSIVNSFFGAPLSSLQPLTHWHQLVKHMLGDQMRCKLEVLTSVRPQMTPSPFANSLLSFNDSDNWIV